MKLTLSVAIALSSIALIGGITIAQRRPNPNLEPFALKQTKQITPPQRGTPDNRSRAGTRRSCGESGVALTPMLPKTNGKFFGYTIDERPTFWFYVPYNVSSGKFSLKNERGKEFWTTNLKKSQTSGLVKIALPATEAPLAQNRSYRWDIVVFCSTDNSSSSSVSQTGIVQRIDDPVLEAKLRQATSPERIAIYRDRQIWYDTNLDLSKLNRSPDARSRYLKSIGMDDSVQDAIAEAIYSSFVTSERPH
jgi:hypothetical protein